MMLNGGKIFVGCSVVPGVSHPAVPDAPHGANGEPDHALCRNEGEAASMISARGEPVRSPGIYVAARDPGATADGIGAHTAMQDGSPTTLLVGRIGTGTKGREASQRDDRRAAFGALAGWSGEGDDAARPPGIAARARATAPTERPRSKTGAAPAVAASPEALPPRQALSRMRDAGLVSRKAKA